MRTIKSSNRLVVSLMLSLMLIAGCAGNPELSFDEYIRAAEQHVSSGEIDKAISAYRRAGQIRPEDANIHFILGKLYQSEWYQSYKEATKKNLFYALSNPDKKITGSSEELAKFGLKLGYDEMAISEFRETIKLDQSNWKARYYIATDHLNKKRYREAINEYKKIIELNPSISNVHALLATAYQKVGSYDLAIESRGKEYQLNSDAEYYYFSLGKIYIKMNNTEKMAEMFNKLRDMKSSYYKDLMDYKYNPD